MKFKHTAYLAIALLFASAVPSMAQEQVLSGNAIGFIKRDLTANQFYMLSNPFGPRANGTAQLLSDVLEGQIPQATQVFVWDAVNQIYQVYAWLNSMNNWFPNEPEMPQGKAFFIRTSGNATLRLKGIAPGTTTGQPNLEVMPGFNLYGYPYPLATTLELTGLENGTNVGDYLYAWDNNVGGWLFSLRTATAPFWSNNLSIQPGDAFFIMARGIVTPTTYSPAVPYVWPNN